MVNIQVLSSVKHVSTLGINPMMIEEGHLSHTKNYILGKGDKLHYMLW
jgi:hypothetical protein